ncbi:MAG TPA: hypothetical protein VEU96_08415 [Bryobacteraceae bacterium]|nr:hypothetical protein [Bryobacteraceae bacterium]
MRILAIVLTALAAGVPAALAQNFKVGDHVEALPYGFDWYPCVVTQAAPNYRVHCTNIDSTTDDYSVTPNRLRPDTGQVAAEMAKRWAQRFPVGSRVDAAPNGEANGYHPCTVLSVKGNGAKIGIYHLRCDYGYQNGPIEVDVGAGDYIRPATSATAADLAKKQAALNEQNRPPAAVRSGNYVCSTFTGGRLQVVPSLDLKVTGPSSYIGRDGRSGSFSYDVASGLVSFRGGAMSGAQAKYLSLYGGQFKMMVNGHTANTDCNLSK